VERFTQQQQRQRNKHSYTDRTVVIKSQYSALHRVGQKPHRLKSSQLM